MFRTHTLTLFLAFLATDCGQKTEVPVPNSYPVIEDVRPHFLNTEEGNTIPTGVPIPVRGKKIHPDSVAKPRTIPLQAPPRVIPLRNHVRKAGVPESVNIPEEPTVIIPGMNGVPPPETLAVKEKVVSAVQTPPVPAGKPDLEVKGGASFETLSVGHGLTNSFVHSMLKDSRGDIWFGTNDGVSRYDGTSFFRYTTEEGLSGSSVWAMLEDWQGHLWFGTNKGICRYDGANFTSFTTDKGSMDYRVRTMMEDSLGNIWIGTFEDGLIRYDGKRFTYFPEVIGEDHGQNVSALYQDSEGDIWIGIWENGVFRLDPDAPTVQFIHYSEKEGLTGNIVWSICEDRRGNLWFGTNNGLSRLEDNRFTHFTTVEGLGHNQILSIKQDFQGRLWFGTLGGGVSCYDPMHEDGTGGYFINYTVEDGLSSNGIKYIFEDDLGRLWFGTWGGGLCRYNGSNFKHYSTEEGLSNNSVRSLMEDSHGNIWIGTLQGVTKFDGDRFTHYSEAQGLIRNDVRSILEDDQGDLWFGTRVGVSRFDGFSFTNYDQETGLDGLQYRYLLQDQRGDIWMGTADHGAYRYDGTGFTHFTEKEGLISNRLKYMAEDSCGRIWFVSGGGASCYDPAGDGTITHYTEKEGLHIDDVESYIEEDSRGRFWFAAGRGISIYNPEGNRGRGSFTYYTTEDGLSGNRVRSIVEDHRKNIWVATTRGLTLFVPLSGKSASGNEAQQGDYRLFTFDMADGLEQTDFFEDVCLDAQNRIWWGTDAGVTMLDLNRFQLPSDTPEIRLNTIYIKERFIDYRRLHDTTYQNSLSFGAALSARVDSVARWFNFPLNLTLPHKLNHLLFEFSAIDWAAPHKIRYSYRMEGFDEHWSLSSPKSKAEYRNLPPGNYTFKVKAIGGAQVWSEVIEYDFRILPPWWLSWWAYLFYGTLILTLLYALRAYELRRYRAQSENRRLIELDAFKTRLYTNITHEFRTPLTIILGMVRQIKDNPEKWYREGLDMIGRNGRQLLSLVNQMLDLGKLDAGKLTLKMQQGEVVGFIHYLVQSFESLAAGKNIKLHFLKETDRLEMDFDPDLLTQVVSNLLSNAVKFTPEGGQIYVTVRNNPDSLAITPEVLELHIRDTGRGIPPEDLPHIFDRFYQVHRFATEEGRRRPDSQYGTVTAEGGAGIGLAVTKELVQLMKGEIRVQSKPGEGSDFSIVLPVTRSAPKLDTALPLVEVLPLDTIMPVGIDHAKAEAVNGPTATAAEKDLPLVLLIEDNRDVLTYLVSCLEADYQLEFAKNGREGIVQALEIVPDIIISDVMMPEKDGYEVCARLKDDIRTSHIPIILLTAKADRDAKLQGLKAGADAYLTKPFDKEELNVRLEKLLELRLHLQARYSNPRILEEAEAASMNKEELFLRNLRKTLEEYLSDESFGIAQLCRSIGMSRSQLHNKLKALTGQSASHYIRAVRLEKAKQLLCNTNLNVSEVAYEVGFRTPLYFTQIFSEAVGVAPSVYRNSVSDRSTNS